VQGHQWRVAAASVRGVSHERRGAPCQDAHNWEVDLKGVLVAAVADGAGSAPFAEVGAKAAANAAVNWARRELDKQAPQTPLDDRGWHAFMQDTLGVARDAVELEAKSRSLPVHDLATTLICIVAGPEFVAALQIGDGAVVARATDGTIISVTRPVQGEYINETTFLCSEQGLASAQLVVWRGPLAHLAIISDGLQMAALRMPGGEPHPGFFNPMFESMEHQKDSEAARVRLVSFLESPRLRARTDDDVTLMLAARIA